MDRTAQGGPRIWAAAPAAAMAVRLLLPLLLLVLPRSRSRRRESHPHVCSLCQLPVELEPLRLVGDRAADGLLAAVGLAPADDVMDYIDPKPTPPPPPPLASTDAAAAPDADRKDIRGAAGAAAVESFGAECRTVTIADGRTIFLHPPCRSHPSLSNVPAEPEARCSSNRGLLSALRAGPESMP